MTQKQPTDALVAGVEDYLAELTDEEFDALVERVRPPADNAAKPAPKPSRTARDVTPEALAAQIPR